MAGETIFPGGHGFNTPEITPKQMKANLERQIGLTPDSHLVPKYRARIAELEKQITPRES